MSYKTKFVRYIIYIFLVLLAVLCFVPFYVMIINSTHATNDLMTGMYILPGTKFLDNYRNMSNMINVWKGFLNSAIISISSTFLSAYFGSLTAFGISKYEFKGRNVVFWIVLASMMIPGQLSIIGLFRLCRDLGILNSYIPLIIPSIANASTIFFVKQYIDSTISNSLLEAARIEGCGELRMFNKIVIPLIKPAIATMSIFNFVGSWNNVTIHSPS